MNCCVSNFMTLNKIQNRCLRICTGALKLTATAGLEVECGTMPLDLRRKKLQIRMVALYSACEDLILKDSLTDTWHTTYTKNKTFQTIFQSVENFINLDHITYQLPGSLDFPLWIIKNPTIDTSLTGIISKKDPSLFNKIEALDFINS